MNTIINTDNITFITENISELKSHLIKENPVIKHCDNITFYEFRNLTFNYIYISGKEFIKIKINNKNLYDTLNLRKCIDEIILLNNRFNLQLSLKEYDIAIDIPEYINPVKVKNTDLFITTYENETSYYIQKVKNKNPDIVLNIYNKAKELKQKSKYKTSYQNPNEYDKLTRLELRLKKKEPTKESYYILQSLNNLILKQTDTFINYLLDINKQVLSVYKSYFTFIDTNNILFNNEDYYNVLDKYRINKYRVKIKYNNMTTQLEYIKQKTKYRKRIERENKKIKDLIKTTINEIVKDNFKIKNVDKYIFDEVIETNKDFILTHSAIEIEYLKIFDSSMIIYNDNETLLKDIIKRKFINYIETSTTELSSIELLSNEFDNLFS